jgi:multicomponent Na+:H+ antiporter subunit F
MFLFATIALFIGMTLVLARLFAGPSLYDRVLAGNAFGTYTVMFIGVLGFLMGRPDFLDIALLYALINFVGTIAVLKFFRYRAIGDTSPTPRGSPTPLGRLFDRGGK